MTGERSTAAGRSTKVYGRFRRKVVGGGTLPLIVLHETQELRANFS